MNLFFAKILLWLNVLCVSCIMNASKHSKYVRPDEFAKDCMNGDDGGSMVHKCQQHALDDFSPKRQNTTVSTLWEMCCAMFEELMCYGENADQYCSPPIAFEVKLYTAEMWHKAMDGLCHDILWQYYCKHHTLIPVDLDHRIVRLPNITTDDYPYQCLNHLKNLKIDESKKSTGNLVDECELQVNKKYNHDFSRTCYVIPNHDACCAMYELMDCLDKYAGQHCKTVHYEYEKWIHYKNRTLQQFSTTTICKRYPYSEHFLRDDCLAKHLKPNHDKVRRGLTPGSIISIIAVLLFVIVVIVQFSIYLYKKREDLFFND